MKAISRSRSAWIRRRRRSPKQPDDVEVITPVPRGERSPRFSVTADELRKPPPNLPD